MEIHEDNAWESLVKITGLLKETPGSGLAFLRTKIIKYKVPSTLGIPLTFKALKKGVCSYRSYLEKSVSKGSRNTNDRGLLCRCWVQFSSNVHIIKEAVALNFFLLSLQLSMLLTTTLGIFSHCMGT